MDAIVRDKPRLRVVAPSQPDRRIVAIGEMFMWELQKEIRIYIAAKPPDAGPATPTR